MTITIPFLAIPVYLIGYIWTWRRLAYNLAHDGYGKPDGDDIVFGLLFGALISIVWPITWLFMFLKALSSDGYGFLLPSRERRHEIEVEQLQSRIHQLEESTGQGR